MGTLNKETNVRLLGSKGGGRGWAAGHTLLPSQMSLEVAFKHGKQLQVWHHFHGKQLQVWHHFNGKPPSLWYHYNGKTPSLVTLFMANVQVWQHFHGNTHVWLLFWPNVGSASSLRRSVGLRGRRSFPGPRPGPPGEPAGGGAHHTGPGRGHTGPSSSGGGGDQLPLCKAEARGHALSYRGPRVPQFGLGAKMESFLSLKLRRAYRGCPPPLELMF